MNRQKGALKIESIETPTTLLPDASVRIHFLATVSRQTGGPALVLARAPRSAATRAGASPSRLRRPAAPAGCCAPARIRRQA
jgi:hypothetical protein